MVMVALVFGIGMGSTAEDGSTFSDGNIGKMVILVELIGMGRRSGHYYW